GCASPVQVTACDGLADTTACSFGREVGTCINGVCVGSLCGNGTLDPGEVCDPGDPMWSCGPDCNRCRRDCLKLPGCGDGLLDSYAHEQCDDGTANSESPNATCRTNCLAPRCGDGIIDTSSGEACEAGQLVGKTCVDFGYYSADGLACNAACGYDTS